MASMPVAAATLGGSVRVLSGSRIASRGNSGKSAISILIFSSGSLMTAAIEFSLPVPAVVGTQASGAIVAHVRRGVLRHAVVDARPLEAAVLDARLDPLDQARAADHLVGDDEHPPRPLLLELEAGRAEQVAARDDPGGAGVLVEVLEPPQRGPVERGSGLHQAALR